MENKSLNESIISIRVKLQNAKIKKSGKNKFAGFDYFELADFLPKLNELMQEEGINDVFKIDNDNAILTLVKGENTNVYTIPFKMFDTPLTWKKDKQGNFVKDKNGEFVQIPSMQDIQYLGALNTYYKRYLYMNAFGITDGEVIDNMDNNDLVEDKHDYRAELMTKLKELNINIPEYAKEHKLNAKTTQTEAKKLLEELREGVVA